LDFIFFDYYLSMIKKLAVFDFDGTITKKDSFIRFIIFSNGRFKFYCGFLLFSPLILAMKCRIYPNWKLKQQIFSFYFKGIAFSHFSNTCTEFRNEIQKIVRSKAVNAIINYQKNGFEVVIISASIDYWILPWAELYGIKTVIGTRIQIDSKGILTGEFLSKNCYGQEKINRLIDTYPEVNEFFTIAFGDSIGDRQLLSFVDEGYYNKFV